MKPKDRYVKICFLVFLMIIVAGGGHRFAKTRIDDLKAKLARVAGAEKVKILNELAEAYMPDSTRRSLDLAFRALSMSRKLDDRPGMSDALINIGRVYLHLNEFDKALEYYLKSLPIKEKIADGKGVALCLNRIATVHQGLRNYDTALEYLIKSKSKAQEIDDLEMLSMTLNGIGVNYWYQEKYDQALEFYQRSLKIKEEIDDKEGISAALNNIGLIYDVKKEYQNALKNYAKSLKIMEEIGYQTGIAITLGNIGEVYGAMKDYKQALRYTTRSMDLAKKIEAKNILRNRYEYLSQLYGEMGNLKKALEYHKLFSAEKDKIFNETIGKKIAEMQTKFESEKKEKEIARLEHEKALQSLELDAQKQFRNFLIGGSILALVFIIIILRAYYHIRKKNELLKGSEERYRAVIEQSNECIFLVDLYSRQILEVNPAFLSLIGYKREEILNMTLYDLLDHSINDVDEKIQKIVRYSFADLGERRYRRQDGTILPVSVRADLIRYSDKDVVCVVARDISERKKAEEKIRASLREKELLLKEIHHRVKNNMQIISSLLALQSKKVKHRETLELFKESQNRIESMALIHDSLYRSRDLAEIDATEYIKKLANSLFSNYQVRAETIKLKLNVDHIRLGIDKMIPCGLILNEIISNSLKHAFPANGNGEIHISFCRENGDKYSLIVEDNGIGMPADFGLEKAGSLGIRLIYNLVEQLQGNVQMKAEKGTIYEITFTG